MAKYLFYYNEADGVIEESTRILLKGGQESGSVGDLAQIVLDSDGFPRVAANPGLDSHRTGIERHLNDVSTFIPLFRSIEAEVGEMGSSKVIQPSQLNPTDYLANSSNASGPQLGTLRQLFGFTDRFRFQLDFGVYFGGTPLKIYGPGWQVGPTLVPYPLWTEDDPRDIAGMWNGSGGDIELRTQLDSNSPENVFIDWGFVYAPDINGQGPNSNESVFGLTLQNRTDLTHPAQRSMTTSFTGQGVNNAGQTGTNPPANADQGARFKGGDAKIRILRAYVEDNAGNQTPVQLSEGWYAVEIDLGNGPQGNLLANSPLTHDTNNGIFDIGHAQVLPLYVDNYTTKPWFTELISSTTSEPFIKSLKRLFWPEEFRDFLEQQANGLITKDTYFGIGSNSATSGTTPAGLDVIKDTSGVRSNNGEIVWTITLSDEYYNTTPEADVANEIEREMGYVIFKGCQVGTTQYSVAHDISSKNSFKKFVKLTKGTNGSVGADKTFKIVLPANEVDEVGIYAIAFFETPDTYRFPKALRPIVDPATNAATMTQVQQWDAFYDYYDDIVTDIINDLSSAPSIKVFELGGFLPFWNFDGTLAGQSNGGRFASTINFTTVLDGMVNVANLCEQSIRYVFEISGGEGELVTAAEDFGGVLQTFGIRGPASEAFPLQNGTNIKFDTDDFYCNAPWTDNIFQKAGTGQFETEVEAEQPDANLEPLSNVTVTGCAKSDRGHLIIKADNAVLDDGFYVVCAPAKSEGNVLTNVTGNSNYQIQSFSQISNNVLRVTTGFVSAKDDSPLLNAQIDGCWGDNSGTRNRCHLKLFRNTSNVPVEIIDNVVNNSSAEGSFFHDIPIIAGGDYTIQLIHGHKDGLNFPTHDGIGTNVVLDFATLNATVESEWCEGERYSFEVDSAGQIITTDTYTFNNDQAGTTQSYTVRGIKQNDSFIRFREADDFKNADVFNRNPTMWFHNQSWSVFRKSDSSSFASHDDVQSSTDTGQQISVKLNGSSLVGGGTSLVITTEDGNNLPTGFYGVCDPSSIEIPVTHSSNESNRPKLLTNTSPDEKLFFNFNSLLASSTVNGRIIVQFFQESDADTGLAGTDVYLELTKVSGGGEAFVERRQVTLVADPNSIGMYTENFDNCPSGEYTVKLFHGAFEGSSVTSPSLINYTGFANGRLLDTAPQNLLLQNSWCNNNLYAFRVFNGKIITDDFKGCGGLSDIFFTNGRYCDAPLSGIFESDSPSAAWSSETEVCNSTTSQAVADVTISGLKGSSGKDIRIFSGGTPLSNGWYAFCTDGTTIGATPVNPGDPGECENAESKYYFAVGSNGEITTQVDVVNGQTTEIKKGFIFCTDPLSQSLTTGGPVQTGIPFPDGSYCSGGQNNGAQQQIQVFSKSEVDDSDQWTDPDDACLACNAKTITNVDIRGNTNGILTASVVNNEGNVTPLPQGTYSYCQGFNPAGFQINVTPNSSCQNEYFIYISNAQGDWDGKIYDCNGNVDKEVDQNEWFDESQLLNYGVKADGNPWTGSVPPSAPPTEACGICSDETSDKGTLYVSGNSGNATDESEQLRVYTSPAEQNPLGQGWYRSCSNSLPVANGVAPSRPKFNCYGNPFIWYSLKNKVSTVVDENSYLTNGSTPWYIDAPLKDLTSTGCDLAVVGWEKEGPTSKSTILRGEYTSLDNTLTMQCSGVTGYLLDFNPGGPYLTRSANFWYPNPETGQKIISSPKTTATEMTIAILVSCETTGTIFKITDVSTVEGSGEYDKLDDLSATLSSIELKKVVGSAQQPNGIYELITVKNDFATPLQNSIQITSQGGYELVVMTLSETGHTIRVDGIQTETSSDSNPSNFCSDNIGITNLNVEIGDNKDDEDASGDAVPVIDMNFLEMIIYDEELNLSEIEELEGYLSHKWCSVLAAPASGEAKDEHPYRSQGPVCGGCDDDCCDSGIHVVGEVLADSWRARCFYASSDPVFGYQFKLTGDFSILDIPDGFYEEGTISVGESASAKEYTLSFEDPLFKSFKNYIQVTSSGIWVYGHFNKHSEDHGGFDYVLPKAERNTGTGFAQEHFLTVTLTQTSGGQVAWGTIGTTGIATSESGINTPAAPHPLLVTDISGEQSVVRSYTGDATGNGSISRDDVRGIIERISTSHENGPYDLSGNSWLETLDANGKGWLDISDAVTCLMNLIRIAGTHLGDPAPVIQDTTGLMKMMSGPICSEKLTPTKCEPCPCPDEPEDEECISRVWISDIQQISTKSSLNSNFAIVTVSYQSSCCIDGYKLTLGGFNDKIVNDEGGFHDGAVLVPSYGNALGQLTDGSETHVRGWLHGLTLDPSYKGDVAFENASEVFAIGTNIVGDLSALANKQFENKLNFPIVWGMSLGQNPLIPTTAEEKIRREQFESGRLGANCIPPTCKGESRILTKFVINMRSFLNPHIAEFRLVTNDNATTPASFGSDSSPISWTGDSDTNTPANGISGADFAACLVYMYSGWGPSTTWDNPSLNALLPPAVSKFDAENDDSYIDIVDSLTVINHVLMKGNDAASDTTIPIVPSDCCPCPTPGSFTVSLDVNPCDCTEEGYVSGKEGQVTITWTESSETKMYVVYRVLEEYHETSTSYSSLDPWNTGLYTNKTLLDIDVAEKTELIFAAKNQSGNSQSITDFGKVQLYKDKIAAAKRPTDFDKWTLIGKFRNDETSVIDKNPISFEKCCPDDVMPRVKYVVVALNDCGQKNVSATYTPECCGDKPAAKDVDIGTLAVNDLASLYSDVYHPFAMNPYGGFNTNATASITVNSAPSVNTVIKLIAWDGTVHECTLLASTSTDVADELAGLIQSTTGSKITAEVENDGFTITLTQSEATICGNTKITVSGDTAAITADERFTGGNKQCIPGVVGYPERCEKLAFFITSIVYSSPRAGDGLFVGPSGGGALPVPNLTGFWSWKPPVDYIGDVTLTYVVVNESGCSDTAKITINYAPPKLLLDCETPGCDEDDYGKVKIKMKLPDIGNAAKFTVLRKPVTTPETPWAEETHTLMDDDGNPLVFSLVDYPDNTFIFVDENVTAPNECCNQPLSYQYKIKYCVYNTLLLPNHQLEFATATNVNFSCAESTVCTVTIPCCPKPHNVIPSVNVAQDCSSSKYAEITITWDGIIETDSPYLYLVYKRKQGTSEWNEVVAVDATPEGKADSNPYWDSANNRYEFVDKIKTSSVCAENEVYEYAIVTMNADKNLSGDPSHEAWGSHIILPIPQGAPCSPGGTTVTATVENCPTPICVEDMNVSICLDEDFEYDLAGFVSCIPNGLDGNPVSVSYALTSSESWVTPSLSGSVLTFNTRNIDFGTDPGQVGTGPHTDAITVTVSTAAPCASSDVLNIDITLVDCGCPCPDDEADYTICDNNYDNEEYVEASKLQNNLEQIPFSLTNEGGQTLRKGQPYVVSKGKIDCD